MSLISVLLIAMSILGLVIGFVSMAGSVKADRAKGIWFFLANVGCAMWTAGCGGFLALSSNDQAVATVPIFCIYIGGLLIAYSMLVYSVWWRSTFGKVYCVICGIFAVVLAALLIYDRSLLFKGEITLTPTGNSVPLYWGWYYIAYCAFFAAVMGGFLLAQYFSAVKSRTRNLRRGHCFLLVSMAICSALSLWFNLLLPPQDYSLIWIGPLSFSLVMISYFYAALKYHMISIQTRWMQVMAYGVTVLIGVMVYMILFYIIFTSLFKIASPAAPILVLNFLMVVIVLVLMPVISELNAQIKSLISVGQVDIAYVIKKLNRLVSKKIDLYELASFLADHLHFSYVGFIINGHLYGSKTLSISRSEIEQIAKMKTTGRNGIWQAPTKSVQKVLDETNLKAVAELYNAKGKPFGQIVVGKPLGKTTMEHRDLIQLEMIVNLVASVIDSGKHMRA